MSFSYLNENQNDNHEKLKPLGRLISCQCFSCLMEGTSKKRQQSYDKGIHLGCVTYVN